MPKNYLWPKQLRTLEYQKYYFQQDGVTPNTANVVQNWLHSKFSKKSVTKQMWPPQSSDLNPCDLFLWSYLKSVVYNPIPNSLNDLKARFKEK